MTDTTKSTPTKHEITHRETCFKGFYQLDRLHLRHELFDGGMSPEIKRELFVRHDAVCVLPYDAKRDEVVLIEQFRVGVIGKHANPWLIEMVAGLIDKKRSLKRLLTARERRKLGLSSAHCGRSPSTFRRPVAVTNLFTCTWVNVKARGQVGCTGWRKRPRTSVCRSGHSMMRCKP